MRPRGAERRAALNRLHGSRTGPRTVVMHRTPCGTARAQFVGSRKRVQQRASRERAPCSAILREKMHLFNLSRFTSRDLDRSRFLGGRPFRARSCELKTRSATAPNIFVAYRIALSVLSGYRKHLGSSRTDEMRLSGAARRVVTCGPHGRGSDVGRRWGSAHRKASLGLSSSAPGDFRWQTHH